MIETDRLVSAQTEDKSEEARFEQSLRPTTLAEYIGQPHVHEQMDVFVTAARNRKEALDHVLLFVQAMPPYELPSEKTKSTLKSNSSKGGQGFNEIRFEDKKGKEQIFVHAEKDEDIRVQNDCKEWIGNERHLIVKSDQLELVEGDKHQTVKGDQNEKVDGTISVEAGMDMQQKVGSNHALEAGNEIHLKGGMKVILEAGIQLTIKAAGSFVDIGPAGVTIQGTMVKINSGGSAGGGSGSSPKSPKDPKEVESGK